MFIERTRVRNYHNEVDIMKDTKQEFCNLMNSFTDYQMRYLLIFVTLINKLSEYQVRYILSFIQKRFNL